MKLLRIMGASLLFLAMQSSYVMSMNPESKELIDKNIAVLANYHKKSVADRTVEDLVIAERALAKLKSADAVGLLNASQRSYVERVEGAMIAQKERLNEQPLTMSTGAPMRKKRTAVGEPTITVAKPTGTIATLEAPMRKKRTAVGEPTMTVAKPTGTIATLEAPGRTKRTPPTTPTVGKSTMAVTRPTEAPIRTKRTHPGVQLAVTEPTSLEGLELIKAQLQEQGITARTAAINAITFWFGGDLTNFYPGIINEMASLDMDVVREALLDIRQYQQIAGDLSNEMVANKIVQTIMKNAKPNITNEQRLKLVNTINDLYLE